MDLMGAIPMPNFDISANTWKLNQVERRLNQVKEGSQKGDNFLIYPSGQLKGGGHEVIGGSSFIHNLLKTHPDFQVVLIRTSGLWGSLFSRAIIGQSPDFWKVFGQGIKIILKNAIFFTPRRKVTVEFELAKENFPYKGSRLELNQYLEKWYNNYSSEGGERVDSEPLKLVSFSPFSKKFPTVFEREEKKRERDLEVPKHIRDDLYQELRRLSGVGEIGEEMDLARDLGLDSLDIATVRAFLDERYDVEPTISEPLCVVYDLLELIVDKGLVKPK